VDMIDWSKCSVTEPPLTMHMSVQQLEENIITSAYLEPQSVERMVKLVTEVASTVCGPEARHALIINTLKSRDHMPDFNTKSSYSLLGGQKGECG